MLNNIVTYLEAELARLKVSAEQYAALVLEQTTWAANYTKYLDTATHNRAVVLIEESKMKNLPNRRFF